MRFDLRQLEMIEAVARLGSLTSAADAMAVTQPAISSQMRKLEDQVGIALLEKEGRGVRLTEAGEEVVHHARRVGLVLDDLNESLRQFKSIDKGLLRVAVVSTANYFITKDIAEFRSEHPGVDINLRVANRDTILQLLDQNETDLAITGQPPDDADVVARPFKDNPLVVIAPPHHELVGRHNIEASELARHSFVVREDGSGTRAVMEAAFRQYGFECDISCVLSSNEAVKQAVQAGLGLAVISKQTTDLEVETGRLAILSTETLALMRRWFVVYRNYRRLSPAALAFRERLLTAARNKPPH